MIYAHQLLLQHFLYGDEVALSEVGVEELPAVGLSVNKIFHKCLQNACVLVFHASRSSLDRIGYHQYRRFLRKRIRSVIPELGFVKIRIDFLLLIIKIICKPSPVVSPHEVDYLLRDIVFVAQLNTGKHVPDDYLRTFRIRIFIMRIKLTILILNKKTAETSIYRHHDTLHLYVREAHYRQLRE